MKKALLACLAVAAILTLAAWAADISGVWIMSIPGPRRADDGARDHHRPDR